MNNKKVNIRVKLEISGNEMESFIPNSVKINIPDSKLELIKDDKYNENLSKGIFWYHLTNISTNKEYKNLFITGIGLNSNVKLDDIYIKMDEKNPKPVEKVIQKIIEANSDEIKVEPKPLFPAPVRKEVKKSTSTIESSIEVAPSITKFSKPLSDRTIEDIVTPKQDEILERFRFDADYNIPTNTPLSFAEKWTKALNPASYKKMLKRASDSKNQKLADKKEREQKLLELKVSFENDSKNVGTEVDKIKTSLDSLREKLIKQLISERQIMDAEHEKLLSELRYDKEILERIVQNEREKAIAYVARERSIANREIQQQKQETQRVISETEIRIREEFDRAKDTIKQNVEEMAAKEGKINAKIREIESQNNVYKEEIRLLTSTRDALNIDLNNSNALLQKLPLLEVALKEATQDRDALLIKLEALRQKLNSIEKRSTILQEIEKIVDEQ